MKSRMHVLHHEYIPAMMLGRTQEKIISERAEQNDGGRMPGCSINTSLIEHIE